MFENPRKPRSRFGSALIMMEVIYHSIVRSVRAKHNNAFMAIFSNMMQAVMFVAAFYIMFTFIGLRASAIRGDFLLYLLSGIFLFITHTKSLGAVAGAEGATSAMMQHAPMNTIISILSAALGALYVQTLSLLVILFIYHVAINPLEIEQPIGAYGMLLIAWFTGCALGLVLMSLKPWLPMVVAIFQTVYQRANMIASGKMFVANSLPGYMLSMFDWNPLFHCIDQARGYAFLNYNPRYSSWEYPMIVGGVLVMIGLMGEFYTRGRISASWNARR